MYSDGFRTVAATVLRVMLTVKSHDHTVTVVIIDRDDQEQYVTDY